MEFDVLFASVPVRDLEAATRWYTTFFDRPPDIIPNEHEAMWRVTDSGWLYLIDDVGRAGQCTVAIAVRHVRETIATLASRGLATGPIQSVGDNASKAIVTDPDGNELALLQVAD